jgi:type IV pilus assembly protein PilM
MGIFRRAKRPALGIDIGSAGVKVLELSTVGRGFKANRAGVEPLPKNAIVEHRINDLRLISDVVRRAVSHSRSSRKKVVVSVPQTHVITRTINLPAGLAEREIEEQVMIEAAQQIPHPLDEVNLDFEVSGGARDGNDDQITITACRKEIVEDYAAVMELAGLSAMIVDVGLAAVERGYGFVAQTLGDSLEGRAIALMDFGDVTTRLDLFVDGHSIYGREQNFGGRILTENVRSRYGIDYREAEALKRGGDLPQNYEQDLLEPFRQAMAREAARSVEFCLSAQLGLDRVDALVISGGCVQIEGIAALIESHVGVPTVLGDPFGPGSAIKANKLVARYGPSMIKAAGLAIRGVG